MKIFIFLLLLMLSFKSFSEEVFTCVDIQSLAIEGRCYNPSPQTPDYVYPFRQCYTLVEERIEEFPDPTDSGIYELTTKVREDELVRLMAAGSLAFDLPEACWPKADRNQ